MDDRLAAEIARALADGEARLDGMESALNAAEEIVEVVEGLGARLTRVAALISDTDPEERAETYVAASFAPLDVALTEVEEALPPAAFDIAWDETAADEVEGAVGDALGEFTEAADSATETIATAATETTSQIVETLGTVHDRFSGVLAEATQASVSAREGHERLQELMSKQMPDLSGFVRELVGQVFAEKLRALAARINSVLTHIETLVDSAAAEIIDRLSAVADLLEEINNIVQPLEPAFDAFEILN
jgi:hypothetical protein